jgi:hypothetical protein
MRRQPVTPRSGHRLHFASERSADHTSAASCQDEGIVPCVVTVFRGFMIMYKNRHYPTPIQYPASSHSITSIQLYLFCVCDCNLTWCHSFKYIIYILQLQNPKPPTRPSSCVSPSPLLLRVSPIRNFPHSSKTDNQSVAATSMAQVTPNNAGAKNVGAGNGAQFITGGCVSNADCSSACCAQVASTGNGVCSAEAASNQNGKTGCGFSDPNAQKVIAAAKAQVQKQGFKRVVRST